MKVPSFYHNNFIVVQGLEDGEPWLMDGFTRLFIASKMVKDVNVFVKSYSKKMSDVKVMGLLASLNFWKTQQYTYLMFDRGFTLYTYMKTGYNIKKYHKEISFYLDSRIEKTEYKYDHSYDISMQKDLLFKNSNFFNDIVTMCKLLDLKFDASEYIQKRIDKKEYVKKDLKIVNYAVPFFRIVGSLRIVNICQNTDFIIDVDKAAEWLQNNPEIKQLAVDNEHSINSTSECNTTIKSQEIFWNKYVLPIVMGKEEVKTTEEKKEEFRKMVNKEKNKYKKVTYEDLKVMPLGTEVFSIDAYYPNLTIKKKTLVDRYDTSYCYKSNIGFTASRKVTVVEEDVFVFENENGKKEEASISKYQMSNAVGYVLKVKK
jgi:hypothetical protein